MPSAVPSRHPKYRTKLCRNFVSGGCPFGEKCSFLHPDLGTIPSSSMAQPLFNWNVLLAQLLALSNQQTAQKTMPPRSPPWPQLIDEDPSPSTSLLLSTSDSTSPEQVPQTKQPGKRKKYPCRHFVRTGGWCPAAGQCKFRHDVASLPSEGVPKAERVPPFATDAPGGGRTISGGVLMGVRSPSPPIINQVHSDPELPRYTEGKLIQPRSSLVECQHFNDVSDEPMYWHNYTWRPYQSYYATVPATTAPLIPATAIPPSVMGRSIYPPLQLQAQTMPPSESQSSLPFGSYEVNGTTYFPTSIPSVPVPPPVAYTLPIHPVPYNYTTAPIYPYYAPPTSYYNAPNRTMNVGLQTSFDPFASDPMMPSELPVIPRLEDYQISPIQQDALPLPLSSPFVPSGELDSTATTSKPAVTQEHEFPYRPPKEQQVGHARRISVNIKKHGRVKSG